MSSVLRVHPLPRQKRPYQFYLELHSRAPRPTRTSGAHVATSQGRRRVRIQRLSRRGALGWRGPQTSLVGRAVVLLLRLRTHVNAIHVAAATTTTATIVVRIIDLDHDFKVFSGIFHRCLLQMVLRDSPLKLGPHAQIQLQKGYTGTKGTISTAQYITLFVFCQECLATKKIITMRWRFFCKNLLDARPHEISEKRVRSSRSRLELRMELYPHKPRMIW